MNRALLNTAAAVALFLAAAPAAAQSDILLQLRSGSPAGDRFRVDSAGGMVALGQITIGIIPASGSGTRMMWHPAKASFRAGYADLGGQFDESNIGYYSFAAGALVTAAGNYSVALGNQNTVEASAQCGTAIGSGNKVWGSAGSIGTCGMALGLNNDVLDQAGVAIGHNNWSDGDAAVAIGYTTTADADYSMAFGYRASTNGHTGAKVFGDASTTDSIEAVANNEFAVRAAGGFRFRSNATLTNGCNIAAGGASITCASSVTLKENFLDVDGDDVLERMRRIPVNSWNYIDEGRQSRHMGPFAEDFWREFGLGAEPLAIGHLDIDGVNFAGVKALDGRTLQMQSRMDEQARQIEQLQADKAALEARIQRLEALLAPTP
ncbi:tail fiber domain-containing protein [Longimicrobium sp.]|uniref:tail fiber domain-containing protein n=1 Tax=Longimicrobium sp. TaxID=2029185 RepID=UPI003B3ABDB2